MLSYQPENLRELSEILGKMTEKSKIIGGGTDLIVGIRSGRFVPDCLLYLGNVSESRSIFADKKYLHIGASVTMSELAKSPLLGEYFGALRDAASDVGSEQVRNRATLGGNIANASPAGDLIPVMCLLNARAHVLNPDGSENIINVKDLPERPGKTILTPNQAIYKFSLSLKKGVSHFCKLGFRTKVTIARIGLAVLLSEDEEKNINNFDIVASAIAGKPVFFSEIAPLIAGKKVDDPVVAEIIGNAVGAYINENTPKEFDRDYKAIAVKGVVADVMAKFAL